MPKTFFSEEQQNQIVEAIRQAELLTSGEIRVHLEPECKTEPYERAKTLFVELGMHATEQKNGVLFYLAYQDKKFAILGDTGIHEKVSQHFWDEVKTELQSHFKQGKFTEGLAKAILQAGEKLTKYFPRLSDDNNELSNDLSFSGDNA